MRARWMVITMALAALLLSGCVPDPVATPAEPTPSSAPVFASEEEALAAAVDAYEAYLAVSDQILIDGGNEPERIQTVAGGEFLKVLMAGFQDMKASGWRSTGGTTARGYELQDFDVSGAVTIYVCEDVSAVDVLDISGGSVVSDTRPDSTLFVATLELVDSNLVVTTRDVWSADSC